MYTYTKNKDKESGYSGYDIIDPNGIIICWVVSRTEAETLLSHLNKQNFVDPYLQTR